MYTLVVHINKIHLTILINALYIIICRYTCFFDPFRAKSIWPYVYFDISIGNNSTVMHIKFASTHQKSKSMTC